MFASKTEWDLKMSVVVAGFVMIVMSFFNLSMGVLGRAWVPDQASLPGGNQDQIYPFLVSQMETVGLKGIVVAGIFAASFSTYDSIGSSLSALLTRDVYARLLVRGRDDHHYLRVGQWLTPVVIGISFLYVPSLLEGGMLLQFFAMNQRLRYPSIDSLSHGEVYESPSHIRDRWTPGRGRLWHSEIIGTSYRGELGNSHSPQLPD